MFQLLRDGQPRTRADLASITGQARSTIAARIDLLMSRRLIAPVGEANSTGGRPPAMFAFNPGAGIVLAADLGAQSGRLAITDLGSRILAQTDVLMPIAEGPEAVLGWVVSAGLNLIKETGRELEDLASVGVGLPGPVEHSTGHPINPPIMPGWNDIDVPRILGGALNAPVLVDNDVNIMALGEHTRAWPHLSDMLFVKVATGVGAGIISEGQIRRGAQGSAGDIGHVAVVSAMDIPCPCGNFGCLEAVASGRAVARILSEAGIPASTSSDVVALVRAGNMTAIHAVRDAGRAIGSVLAGCVNLLNPSIIVVGGALAEAGEHLIAGIREVVYRRSLPLATQHLRIVSSQSRGLAGVLGASAMAIDHVLSPAAIDNMASWSTVNR